jgi:hypothetical protein
MVTLRRGFAAFVLLLIGSSLWAQVSHSLPAIVYGPEVFARQSRNTSTATASFSLPQLVYGPFSLFIVAPFNDGVVVQLNGNTVFGDGVTPFPFAPQTVTLQAENSLNITLPNTVGVSVIITILGYEYEFTQVYQHLPLAATPPVPTDIDWREKGAVTPVKNEGTCQSDWAFSATGATESYNSDKTGTLRSLSEQELLDCVPRPFPNCANGNPATALAYIAKNGDDTESAYPYTGKVGVCKAGSSTPISASFTTTSRFPVGDEDALTAAVDQQPISVVLISNWYAEYASGVANPSCSATPPTFSAALIVGYGTDSTTDPPTSYWLVKNSLGTSWGENGYFRIVRGQDACAIADFALVQSN